MLQLTQQELLSDTTGTSVMIIELNQTFYVLSKKSYDLVYKTSRVYLPFFLQIFSQAMGKA
jgi:hypothetical protein